MKLCRAVFFLLGACALHSVACRPGGNEDVGGVGAVETPEGESMGVPTHEKTTNVGGDAPNGGKGEAEEELKKAKEDVQKAKDLAHKCEKQKRETLLAAQTAQKNLQECTHNSGIDLTKCKAQLSDREKHLYVCRENEDKCYEKIKDMGKEHEESVSRKENEAAELREKLLKLERTLEEMELKLKVESYEGAGRSHIDDKDSDYLISFPMVRSYFVKVLKIYKTFYIIVFEQTNLSGFLSQVALHKDAVMTQIKLYGNLTMEKLHGYKTSIGECDWVNGLLSLYENSSLSQYIQLIKRKVVKIASTVRRLFLQKVVYPVSRDLYPQMTQSMRNKYKNINWDLFLHKLHNNSEFLVVKLNSINPELQGIISPRLEDQLILLIFFTALSKRVSMCLFTWSYLCLSVIYRCTVFVITLPIRPFMRKRGKRSRKVYRRHDERTCTNPERVSYLQQEVKKMHKGHSVHQRRG
ncbi:Uncharacterized protein PCOAH_00031180 [Plasmodium coatneyi]|uniref:Uncharacterized protein n=1 Tax=Plasmodium coatneyi TaxID=208452 RepID=A0A1B1E0V1_9APIC|nr:Uncharacterized protein PCOAH_00031180 [Plasmodium coatneyi]ANQ08654.1 Uncharacterized protein PCOAH_00031180 [Plasmodium coatneyi]